MSIEQPHRLVTTLEERFRSLETEFHEAYWRSQIEASPEADRRRAELELQLRRAKGDAEALAAVERALAGDIHDPILHRQLEVLRLSLLGNQMQDSHRATLVELSTEVESDYASFRPEIDGRRFSENEIEEILRSSDDDDRRRRAWEASKEIGGVVAERVRELVRVRNEVARDLGFADYYHMALDLQELSEEWLFATLDQLERQTLAPFEAWKGDLDARVSERFGVDVVYPWHYADPFFQQLPPDGRVSLDGLLEGVDAKHVAEATFGAWGIDLSGVMGASDLYPRERKAQYAFCLDVDRGGDVRILANIVPGERWIEVMLHESGHAAYEAAIDRKLPYLLRRPAHTFVTEAIAILAGRFVRNTRWLATFAGVEESELAEIRLSLESATAAQSVLFARWGLVMVHFERDLYSDPEGDLDARWWELVERFQRVPPPPGRSAPDWAAKVHTATAPVYYHNYLLGELLASQLEATCETECGGVVGNEAAGALLRERIFSHGSSRRWDEVVEQATDRALSATDFSAGVTRRRVG